MLDEIKIEESKHYHLFRSPWAKIWNNETLRPLLFEIIYNYDFVDALTTKKKDKCSICNKTNFDALIKSTDIPVIEKYKCNINIHVCEDCIKLLKEWKFINYKYNYIFKAYVERYVECPKSKKNISIKFSENSKNNTICLKILEPSDKEENEHKLIKEIKMGKEDFEEMIKNDGTYKGCIYE